MMTSNNPLAAWLGFTVSTAMTARLSGRVVFSPAGGEDRKAKGIAQEGL